MVLLSMFTLPFKCVRRLDAVEVLDVVIAILAIVLLLMLEKGKPVEVENRIKRGVGVPVVPPVYVQGAPPAIGADPPMKLFVIVKLKPKVKEFIKIAP